MCEIPKEKEVVQVATYFVVNRISRWWKWMRPETQKQQAAANSRIKTSAAEGVLKILEIYAKATEF